MRFAVLVTTLFFSFLSLEARAEYRTIGNVELQGLSRDTGSINPPGLADVMTCNLTAGTDENSWIAVRSGPGTQYDSPKPRMIERLAILRVDSNSRQGRWLYVTMGYRTHTKFGETMEHYKDLNLKGWVHDGYLCDFLFL